MYLDVLCAIITETDFSDWQRRDCYLMKQVKNQYIYCILHAFVFKCNRKCCALTFLLSSIISRSFILTQMLQPLSPFSTLFTRFVGFCCLWICLF